MLIVSALDVHLCALNGKLTQSSDARKLTGANGASVGLNWKSGDVMAKKTKERLAAQIELDKMESDLFWTDLIEKYLTRSELERVAKKLREDLGR